MIPKIFVGTMYCGEGEFKQCCDMIYAQKDVEIDFRVFPFLPEKEAHNVLWKTWTKEKINDFNMFTKIDADTVLRNENILRRTWELFEGNSRVTSVQSYLYDYMTDTNICGLNSFSRKVVFRDVSDDLYCERVDMCHDIQLGANSCPPELTPAGYHCCSATEQQAFHYGLHRKLKNQSKVLADVRNAWIKNGKDRIRGYALLGASVSYKFSISHDFNYFDKKFCDEFDLIKNNYDRLAPMM